MENKKKEIRFIDPHYNEKFRIPDGGKIRIEYPEHPQWNHNAVCRYIDDYHLYVNSLCFHICEFAERMEQNGGMVRPEIDE